MEYIVLIIIGLIAGIIGALVGLGGGIVMVPSLLFFGNSTSLLDSISPQVAVGVATVIMIFTGLSSTLTYMKHKTVDYKAGFIFFIGSAPGGIIGAHVNKILDIGSFLTYFGLFMIIIAMILIIKNHLKPIKFNKGKGKIIKTYINNEEEHTYGYYPLVAVLIAFLVGFCSGLFGIGGGSIMVPVMILLFFFPPHVAVATSMFMVFLSSLTNSITHISLGNVNWLYTLALIPGAWFGAKFGAIINTRLKGRSIEYILKIVLILIGIRLVYQGITGQ